MKTISVIAASFLLGCAICLPAQGQIHGIIDFGVSTVSYDTNSLATATEITSWGNPRVTLATGDFATFQVTTPGLPGDPVTVTAPYIFNSGTPGSPLPGPAVSPLWSVDGFTFDLTSSSIQVQNANFLDITGTGTISGHGFASTPGEWSFTSTNSSGQPAPRFTFTAETVSTVPEPGTWGLLLLGAFVLAACNHRRISLALR